MYARGRGVEKDLSEAARWFSRAAAQCDELARRNLETVDGILAFGIDKPSVWETVAKSLKTH